MNSRSELRLPLDDGTGRVGVERTVALMPAAGTGTRFDASQPKQYLELAGRPLIEWALLALLDAPWIEHVAVVVSPGDTLADAWLDQARQRGVHRGEAGARFSLVPCGGATRRDTVANGLRWLARERRLAAQDWVLVHDAARAGLDADSLERLRSALRGHACGGLLAQKVVDTVKRADESGHVASTVARDHLWLAQTPQMFRCALLADALERYPEVTDESSAIEAAGLRPLLVEGSDDNFKLTRAGERLRMQDILRRRRRSREQDDE